MGRRIYIIPAKHKKDGTKDLSVTKQELEVAQENKCPEIVHGIPPRLAKIIDESSLPMVFEEPEPEPAPEPRDLAAEIDSLKAAIREATSLADLKAKLKED